MVLNLPVIPSPLNADINGSTFFMLNAAEHEFCPANKSQITNNAISFLKNIAEHENFSANKYENANNSFIFISRKKFHAQLS